MRLVQRVLTAGRIGRRRSFVSALVVAMLLLPVATAAAFFAATGTGTITNVQAGSANSTVSILGSSYVYAGPSTTNLMPGGTVTIAISVSCLTGCPASVGSINLGSWTSDKAGCDIATLPGSFTMPADVVNASFTAAGGSGGSAVITWVNLGVSQNACAGAKFAFTLVTP
jgi:hypothetical protein